MEAAAVKSFAEQNLLIALQFVRVLLRRPRARAAPSQRITLDKSTSHSTKRKLAARLARGLFIGWRDIRGCRCAFEGFTDEPIWAAGDDRRSRLVPDHG
jgi:hypothetical protein